MSNSCKKINDFWPPEALSGVLAGPYWTFLGASWARRADQEEEEEVLILQAYATSTDPLTLTLMQMAYTVLRVRGHDFVFDVLCSVSLFRIFLPAWARFGPWDHQNQIRTRRSNTLSMYR